MRNRVIQAIYNRAKQDDKIFFITGDAGFGVLDEYQKCFRTRFLNLGVAEQNMISFSAGMAIAGYKVFVYNIVPFVLYRCFEQVRNDICYQNLAVTLIGIGSGVTYAPQGVTHYSIEDILLARALPNLVVLSPCDPQEASLCAEYACVSKSPVYIRIAKSGELPIHEKKIKSIDKPIIVREGRGVAVLFHGSIAPEVIKAVAGLKAKPRVISVPMLQPLDFVALKTKLKDIHTIITVEEHFVRGGLGTLVAEWIASDRPGFKLINLGIRNEFIHAIRNNTGMRRLYGISHEEIAGAITAACKKG